MADENERTDQARREESKEPAVGAKVIRLNEYKEPDLSGLSDDQASTLQVNHYEAALDHDDRRETLKEDITATAAKLHAYINGVRDTAEEEGPAVAILKVLR